MQLIEAVASSSEGRAIGWTLGYLRFDGRAIVSNLYKCKMATKSLATK